MISSSSKTKHVGQVGRALAEIIKPFIAGCRLNSGNSLNLACANNWLQLKLLFPCTLHILFNIFKDILKLVHCSCHCQVQIMTHLLLIVIVTQLLKRECKNRKQISIITKIIHWSKLKSY